MGIIPKQQPEMPVKDDTVASLEMITIITMLLQANKRLGFELEAK